MAKQKVSTSNPAPVRASATLTGSPPATTGVGLGAVLNRGRLGWAVEWPNGAQSYMPDEATARACAAAPALVEACKSALPMLVLASRRAADAGHNDECDRHCMTSYAIDSALTLAQGKVSR